MLSRFSERSGARLIALAFAAVCSVVVVATVAAHGGDGSKIHSCVQNVSGNLRIVDPGGDCKSNEVALDWNGQGPVGPPGAPGPSGALALANKSCPSGQFVTGFDANGDLICAAPPTATAAPSTATPTLTPTPAPALTATATATPTLTPTPAAPSCTEDGREPNETGATASDLGSLSGPSRQITISGSLCAGEDWFHVRTIEDGTPFCFSGSDQGPYHFTATLNLVALADLDLDAHIDSPAGPILISHNSGNQPEQVTFEFTGTCGLDDSRDFFIRVFPFAGAQNSYSLTLTYQQ